MEIPIKYPVSAVGKAVRGRVSLSRGEAKGRVSPSRGEEELLTIAEHLVVCELPIFGKKDSEFEIHRALTRRQQKIHQLILLQKHTQF